MIAGQDFIPGLQVQRSSNQVDPIGGIGHKYKICGSCPQIFPKRLDGLPDEVMILPSQEQHWLLFQLRLPALILFKDWFRAGTEGTVV